MPPAELKSCCQIVINQYLAIRGPTALVRTFGSNIALYCESCTARIEYDWDDKLWKEGTP